MKTLIFPFYEFKIIIYLILLAGISACNGGGGKTVKIEQGENNDSNRFDINMTEIGSQTNIYQNSTEKEQRKKREILVRTFCLYYLNFDKTVEGKEKIIDIIEEVISIDISQIDERYLFTEAQDKFKKLQRAKGQQLGFLQGDLSNTLAKILCGLKISDTEISAQGYQEYLPKIKSLRKLMLLTGQSC